LYWRRKGANMRRERGRWFGPASVVAVEGSRNVWLNHSGRLVRACPEQIRPASFREWRTLQKQRSVAMEESSPGRFSQNLRGGVFIDLSNDGIPQNEDDGEYSPSELEPEVETSIKSPEETEPGEIDLEKPCEPHEVPVPDTPFESEGEMSSNELPENETGQGEPILFGNDVEFGRPPPQSFDVWEMSIPLEQKQEVRVFCSTSADESVLLVSDSKKRKVEVKLSNLKSEDQFRMAVAKHKEIGAWLKHSTVVLPTFQPMSAMAKKGKPG